MEKTNYSQKAIEAIGKIAEAEPEFLVAVAETLDFISKTYSDKYEGSKALLDTKAQLYHPVRGAAINPYQMSRYLQRFMSEGFAKSENKNDVIKIIHYGLFDMVRMNRMGNAKNADIVDGKPEVSSKKEFEELDEKE